MCPVCVRFCSRLCPILFPLVSDFVPACICRSASPVSPSDPLPSGLRTFLRVDVRLLGRRQCKSIKYLLDAVKDRQATNDLCEHAL